MSKKRHRCLNIACHCICEKETEYCSEECTEADDGQEQCDCDHDDCYPHSGLEDEDFPVPR